MIVSQKTAPHSLEINAIFITEAQTDSANTGPWKMTHQADLKERAQSNKGPLITRSAVAHKPQGLQPTAASWSTTRTYVLLIRGTKQAMVCPPKPQQQIVLKKKSSQ